MKATDLRAGAKLIIAGLIACGRTEVEETSTERGYECVAEKFRGLGGKMEKNCSAGYGCKSGLSDRLNSFGFGVLAQADFFEETKNRAVFSSSALWDLDGFRQKGLAYGMFCKLCQRQQWNQHLYWQWGYGVLIDLGISHWGILTTAGNEGIDRKASVRCLLPTSILTISKGLKLKPKKPGICHR